ncbi:hypothetical protein GLU60_03660 [Nanohaloarchaea archaeon H01]|nr:hypothetical protein [Nanohaloarchaea archaeon H01]
MNKINLNHPNKYLKFKKYLSVILAFILAVNIGLGELSTSETDVDVTNPSNAANYDRNNDLVIEWDSVQYHASQDTLEDTEINIIDGDGAQVTENITLSQTANNGEIISNQYTFTPSDLSSLKDSRWDISLRDSWSQDVTASRDPYIKAGDYGEVSSDIRPAETRNYVDLDDGFEITWDSTNDYNIQQNLIETDFTFEDGKGNEETITRSIGSTVSSYESTSNTESFSPSDFNNLESGDWTVNVSDTWDEETSSGDTLSFTAGVGSISSSILSPSSSANHNPNQNLNIEWESKNDYDVGQKLQSTQISVSDGSSSVDKSVSIDTSVSQGSTKSNSATILSSDLDTLNEGSWTISITDTWDYGDSTDSVSITGETVEGSVSTTISNPSSSLEHNSSDDLTVDWSSTNNYNTGQELVESEVRVEGDSGIPYTETVSVGETVSSGSTFNHDALNLSSEDLSELNPGDWDVTVTDTWELDESSSTVTFTAEDQSQSNDKETESSANYSIGVSSPSSGSSFDYDSGEVTVEWTSSNDGDSSRKLTESSVIFEGGAGLTEIDSIDRGESVSSGDSVSRSVTYDSSTWESLEPGDFTLTVRDDWEDGETVEGSVDVSIDSETDSSQDPDNSTDDSTDEDTNSSENGSDSTNDSSDGGSSNDQDEEGSDSEDNACPEGFSWDDGVCVEDSGDSSDSDSDDSDGSTDGNEDSTDNSDSPNDDSSDDGSSTDDQNSDGINGDNEDTNTSMLQQEVAAGISVQTVFLGVLAVLTLGLLFKRSSYTLKF